MPVSTRARLLRWLLALLVVGALVTLLLWPKPALVDTARVAPGTVRDLVEAEGRTRLRDRFVITAPIAATARRLELEPGDAVQPGQTLVTLEPLTAPALDARARAEAQARIAAARTRTAAAREVAAAATAQARQARADAERLQRLKRDQMVAAATAEQARVAAEQAERTASSARFLEATAQHELSAAQAVLAHGSGERGNAVLRLTAPVAGVVLRRHYESARPVNPGEPLLEIGDPDGLEIEVDVLSSDAVRLRPGMHVELVRWGETQPLQGRVRRIEPGGFTKVSALGVEEQRVWVIVDITSPHTQWQQLGEAYRVNARFVLRESRDTLRIPASAVFFHDNDAAVFRIEQGKARRTPITTGLQGEGWTEIRRGLKAGDIVVVHPDRALADGDRVHARGN
ncbi:efflux RND transporter periplasmic adaptor subunit [Lysobacter olei]